MTADGYTPTILVVDHDPARRAELVKLLAAEGCRTLEADRAVTGFNLATTQFPDAVISALRLPGVDGVEFAGLLDGSAYPGPVALGAEMAEAELFPAGIAAGAAGLLPFPLAAAAVRAALAELLDLADELSGHLLAPDPGETLDGIVAANPALMEVRRNLPGLAAATAPILITGERGTGKQLIARRLHQLGPRAKGPFLALHLGAAPTARLAPLLHGADGLPGRLALAAGGTLFLDEIELLPAELQPLLADAPGADRCRIVAATTQNPAVAGGDGRLTRDLQQQLGSLTVHLPPVRRRKEELPALAAFFLRAHTPEGETVPRLPQETAARLRAYHWPGNLRQLETIVKYLLAKRAGEAIRSDLLPGFIRRDPAPVAASATPAGNLEQEEIALTLKETGHDRGLTAALLGLTRRELAARHPGAG